MKTRTDFLVNYSRHPYLAKAVLAKIGEDWKELIQHPYDYRDASGGVSGFIYYTETVKFAKRHLPKIIIAVNEFEEETGAVIKKPTDETQLLNWYAWFALENTIDEVIRYLEDE